MCCDVWRPAYQTVKSLKNSSSLWTPSKPTLKISMTNWMSTTAPRQWPAPESWDCCDISAHWSGTVTEMKRRIDFYIKWIMKNLNQKLHLLSAGVPFLWPENSPLNWNCHWNEKKNWFLYKMYNEKFKSKITSSFCGSSSSVTWKRPLNWNCHWNEKKNWFLNKVNNEKFKSKITSSFCGSSFSVTWK